MAHKKAAGTTKNGRDSNPRYLGIKINAGEKTKVGSIIVRQKGGNYFPGQNVGIGKDYTIFALKEGVVKFSNKRKQNYDSTTRTAKMVHVL